MLQAGTTTFPAKWVKSSVNLAQSGGRRVELSIHWVEASQSQTRISQPIPTHIPQGPQGGGGAEHPVGQSIQP